MLVPLQGALQQLLVFRILWNTVEEALSLRGARITQQSEAPAQVRELAMAVDLVNPPSRAYAVATRSRRSK